MYNGHRGETFAKVSKWRNLFRKREYFVMTEKKKLQLRHRLYHKMNHATLNRPSVYKTRKSSACGFVVSVKVGILTAMTCIAEGRMYCSFSLLLTSLSISFLLYRHICIWNAGGLLFTVLMFRVNGVSYVPKLQQHFLSSTQVQVFALNVQLGIYPNNPPLH